MNLNLLPAQFDFAMSDEPFPSLIGGLGSGKTRAGTIRLILLLLQNPGLNGAYYLPTYDLINLRAIPGVEEDLDLLGYSYLTNKSKYEIDIHGYGKIIFRSYDNPNRIIAYEVAHSICDELDTLTKEKASVVWRKITERNRQKHNGKNTIGLVTTPDQGVNGFVYEKWVKKQQKGYILYKASTYDNHYLPPDYAENIIANYDPILARLYLEGEFVSLTDSKVYHYFNRQKHHTDRTITHNDQYLHIGQDFNIGACCSTVFVIDSGYPVIVDEFISHDTRDLCIQLSSRYPNKHISIYPDASGQSRHTNASESDIDILRAAGFTVMVNGMNPAIRDRINAFNGLLAHDKIKINTNTCPNITHALESQGYDKKGLPEKFDEHPAIDDWADSAGYCIAFKWPVAGIGGVSRLTGY